jgi:hypothetical protein
MPDRWMKARALAILAAILGSVGYLDCLGTFRYVPYSWGALVASIGAAVVLRSLRPQWLSACCAALFLAVLVLVPWVRWNHLKSFYLDCSLIETGARVDDARTRMRAYRLQQISKEGSSQKGLERPHLTFHPDLDHSADWCVVYFEGERVTEVEALPD